MNKIIKTLLLVMALVLALAAFTGCELPGTECTHEGYATMGQSVDPTCTETGLSGGIYCSNCDAVISEPKVWEALGHEKTEYIGTTATCTEAGVETWGCGRCGETYELEVEAYGHELADVKAKAATCTEDGYTAHKACAYCDYTEGKEVVAAIPHNYVYGVCECGAQDPTYVDYYLVGWINGADHGCEGDYMNLGEYKFVDGKLTAQFTGDCYVFVKSGNLKGENVNWYLAESYVTGKEATLYINKPEKMWIPGGVEVVFTLTVNEDGTLKLVADYHVHNFSAATCTEPKKCDCGATEGEALGHNLVDGVCTVCGIDLSPKPLSNAVLDLTTKANRTFYDAADKQVWEANGIKLTNTKGEGTSNVQDKAPFAAWAKGYIIIEGKGMKTIKVVCSTTTLGTFFSRCLKAVENPNFTYSNSGTTYTIVFNEAVDIFELYLTDQTAFKSITINPAE